MAGSLTIRYVIQDTRPNHNAAILINVLQTTTTRHDIQQKKTKRRRYKHEHDGFVCHADVVKAEVGRDFNMSAASLHFKLFLPPSIIILLPASSANPFPCRF